MKHKLICKLCGKEYERQYITKYCSCKCSNECKGGDRSSLNFLVSRYGEEEGNRKYIEHSRKLSEANTGKVSIMKGKYHSEESKIKISNSVKNSEYHTNLKKNGRTEEEKKKISECMKGVFTIEWFIKKYGETIGLEKHKERSRKIAEKSFFKIYNKTNRQNYSKKSQKLFWELYNRLHLENQRVYFAELNHEYGCETNTNFDFVWIDKKKVIEFNGNIWHANPKYFNGDSYIRVWNMLAKDVWIKDNIKNENAKNNGYDILVIWESDFDCNKKETVDKCIDFLIGE